MVAHIWQIEYKYFAIYASDWMYCVDHNNHTFLVDVVLPSNIVHPQRKI